MFERVLIANRGEIAARIARTLRRLGVASVSVHAEGDPALAAARAADATVEIGSYLDADAIVEAALRAGAQAVHPGYGFLSERPELARACAAAGLAWVGPPVAAIELMGDKAAARRAAERAGVPVVPGLEEPSPEQIAELARRHGLPLLVKAAAGGGGKGMRLVRSLDELDAAFEGARREAAAAFGDDALLVEVFVAPARHIELQVLADAHGTVVDLGERECSLQRRHQKVVEETPSPAVSEALRAQLAREGIALARACGYVGAGTIEFVADAARPERHWFLEMNTRLQVEHPVTEEVHGIDLVEWQLRIAAGERLELDTTSRGHAIEARVYAEDPARGFLPAAGRVRALRLPSAAPGIRVEAGVAVGEEIGTRYDPLVAKVIAHGATREQARLRLVAALRETAVLGVRSNVAFLCELLEDARVRAGALDTALVEAMAVAVEPPARAALVALLAETLPQERPGDVFAGLRGWRVGGVAARVRRALVVDGAREVALELAPPPGEASVDGRAMAVAVEAHERLPGGGLRLRVVLDGVAETWTAARDGEAWWVGSDGAAWVVGRAARARREDAGDGGGVVRAPMPGAVVAVHAQEGEHVERGEVLLVLESMKMELQITAPRDGTVAALHVATGDQVALDTVLVSVAA